LEVWKSVDHSLTESIGFSFFKFFVNVFPSCVSQTYCCAAGLGWKGEPAADDDYFDMPSLSLSLFLSFFLSLSLSLSFFLSFSLSLSPSLSLSLSLPSYEMAFVACARSLPSQRPPTPLDAVGNASKQDCCCCDERDSVVRCKQTAKGKENKVMDLMRPLTRDLWVLDEAPAAKIAVRRFI
jgi:hypothetical protein